MTIIERPNSWVSQDSAANTTLSYALQLDPAPLTVSLSGHDPIFASLEFVLTNPTASPIDVSSVAFTIQVGTESSNLTTSTATIGASVSDSTRWQIQMPGTITSGPAIYTLQPKTGSSVAIAPGASVVVEIYNFPTIHNPGSSIINIKETAGGVRFTSFQVTTFPTGFHFYGLSATVEQGSQLVPVAQVGAGNPVTLVWYSSVVDLASVTIYYSDPVRGQRTVTPSIVGLWTSPPLSADTVFTVVITVSVAGGSPLTAALSTSVAVQNPALVAGQATVSGPLAVSGASTLANVNINNSLTAIGLATLTGGLQLTGPLGALQSAVAIQPGNYGPAPTDGFVYAYTSGSTEAGALCSNLLSGSSGGLTLTALGGNVVIWILHSYWASNSNPATLLLPVKKGNGFSISSFIPTYSKANAPTSFWWIPFGASSSPQQMATLRLGDAPSPREADLMYIEQKGRS
jgi:hypothetical protein